MKSTFVLFNLIIIHVSIKNDWNFLNYNKNIQEIISFYILKLYTTSTDAMESTF